MKIYIYSGTHWDREWYKSFQGFRYMLVRMTNDLLDGLESTPDYKVFHFDGQTVVLHDYLQIEPGQRARLTRLIQEGKIRIGPWFCMPDEFLLSGESLIRNLQLGHQIAREEFDVEPPRNAYICDIFGHAAQTPQIFAGMNLHHTVLGRGTNEHTTPMHFRWAAPDGTEVLAYKLNDRMGYGDFSAFAGRNPIDEDPEVFAKNAREYIDHEIARANIPVVCLLDAVDHLGVRLNTAQYIKAIQKLYPDAEIIHGDIDQIDADIAAFADQLPVREGELNEVARVNRCDYLHLITNTLSSRYGLKKYNDRMQTRLEKWMSPLYAFGLTQDPIGFLNLAYRYLLQNHPHDSICGCSIDQVHRDMMYRFNQTDMISSEVLTTSMKMLHEGSGEKKILRIFNPLPYAARRTVEATLRFEKDFPSYGEPFVYELIHAFRLYDAQGCEVPYGIVDIRAGAGNSEDIYTLAFDVDLTPMGITELRVEPSDVPTRYPECLPGTMTSAEGEHLAIDIGYDGSICLTDFETGESYPNLLQLVDDGEIGDGWWHVSPAIDRTITCNSATIEKIEENTVRTTFRIVQQMRLPKGITQDHGYRRGPGEWVDFHVEHEVTVSREGRAVYVRTLVHNNACDHRLRLRLATGVDGDTYYASEAFCFVRRACNDRPETARWKEYGCVEKAFSGIVLKQDPNNEERGLAFISAYGLHECGVWDNGNIDITLLRACDRTVRTEGEPDGQQQGTLEYRYAIMPLGNLEEKPFAMLQREQDFLSAGIECGTGLGEDAQLHAPIAEIECDHFIYSTASRVDEKTSEMRLVNFSDESRSGTVLLPEGVQSACLTEIDGRPLRDLSISAGRVSLDLGRWKIATLRFTR